MEDGRVVLKGLYQIGFDSFLEQQCHSTYDLKITCKNRSAIVFFSYVDIA